MLKPYLLSYINMIKDLETESLKCNPYDPCVSNKIMYGEPLTLIFYVDGAEVVHKKERMIYNFEQWIDFMYGYPNIRKANSVRRKIQEYLSMNLDGPLKGTCNLECLGKMDTN